MAAVATLGLNAAIRGDTESARRYFAYSDTLSRRDFRTRLWMIEDAVAREDIPGAIRNYDLALRTSRGAPALLYPILTSAISDETIRIELVKRVVVAKPTWLENFVDFVAAHGEDPLATSQLFQGLRRVGVPISDSAWAGVLGKLVAAQDYSAAWTYYARLRGNADRRRSRDPKFTANLSTPSPLDWNPLGGDAGISTVIQRSENEGLFDFSVPSSVGGPLLQQLQLLPPGDYGLQGRSLAIEQTDNALPYWVLSCADGKELGRAIMTNSSEAEGIFRGRFTVPVGCPAQYLRLVARPSNAVGGLSGQIKEVALRPLG